jgi:hypothetical protein
MINTRSLRSAALVYLPLLETSKAVHEQNKLHKKSEAVEIDVSRLTGTNKGGQRSF